MHILTSSHMHILTLTNVHAHVLTHAHSHTPSHAHPHTYTPSHTCTLTYTHPHTCTPTHTQTFRVLYSIVLFDPLAADFYIDGVWLVMYNGQQRPLSGQKALQAVGTQINQKMFPPERIHVKVHLHVHHLHMYHISLIRCHSYFFSLEGSIYFFGKPADISNNWIRYIQEIQ